MAVALTTLRSDVRRLVNEPNTNGQLGNTQLDEALNHAQRSVYFELLQHDENYEVTSSTISLVADTEVYSMPSGTLRIVDVQKTDGDLNYSLTKVPLQKRLVKQGFDLTSNGTSAPAWYYIQGDSLGILPIPSAAGTLTVYYYPTLTDMDTGTPVNLSLPDEFRRWVALAAAVEIAVYLKEARPDLRDELAREAGRMIRFGDTRSVSSSRHVIDRSEDYD